MNPHFVGRLFGPGLPGSGVAANGHWRGHSLHLSVDEREFVVNSPSLDARGFNAAHWRVSWTSSEGDFAFFLDSVEAKTAFANAAPSGFGAAVKKAAARQNSVERRFRWGWVALGLFLLLPFIAIGVFIFKADVIAEWAVANIPIEQEARIGDFVLAQTRAQMPLVDRGAAVDAVRAIGERLTVGTRHRYRWYVADRPEANAFAAPGGVVVVFSGLLRQTASAEEAAGVIAHEVAHAELRHGMQNMAKQLGLQALVAFALGDTSGAALSGIATDLIGMSFSRDAEREADADGLRRLVAAQIDPKGMVTFFEKLSKLEKGATPPAMLSTHPATGERIDTMREASAAIPIPAAGWSSLGIDWTAMQASL